MATRVLCAPVSLYQNFHSAWSNSNCILGLPLSCGRKNAKQSGVLLAASSCFDCLSKQRSPQLANTSVLTHLIQVFLLAWIGVPSPVQCVLSLINNAHPTDVTVAQVLTCNHHHLGQTDSENWLSPGSGLIFLCHSGCVSSVVCVMRTNIEVAEVPSLCLHFLSSVLLKSSIFSPVFL